MKIDRLIGIITLLLQNDKVTAPYLAERYEVSRRTINRDIEDICKAGIPLVTTQGYGGGISIAEGYRIDKTLIKEDELQAIFVGLKSIDSVSKNSYASTLIDKLYANNSSILSASDHILIDLASHYQESLTSKIEIIRNSINKQKIVEFDYYSNKGDSRRFIEPYYIVFKWSSWYLYGYCMERKDYRLFKLNRLWHLQQTLDSFDLRKISKNNLDFDDYFTEEIPLVALFDESTAYRLIEEYGIDSFARQIDGRLLFKSNFTSRENLMAWILSFGDNAEVLEPADIRDEIIRKAQNVIKKYK